MILTVWIRLLSAMPNKKSKSHWFEYNFIDYSRGPSFPSLRPAVSPINKGFKGVKKWGSMIYDNSAEKNFARFYQNFDFFIPVEVYQESEPWQRCPTYSIQGVVSLFLLHLLQMIRLPWKEMY